LHKNVFRFNSERRVVLELNMINSKSAVIQQLNHQARGQIYLATGVSDKVPVAAVKSVYCGLGLLLLYAIVNERVHGDLHGGTGRQEASGGDRAPGLKIRKQK
jgi:hypothetical protein